MVGATRHWPGAIRKPFAALLFVAVAVAPFLAHLAIATGRERGLAAALSGVQVLVLILVAWRTQRGAGRAAISAAATLLLLMLVARLIDPALSASALLLSSGASHALIYGSLLTVFARSLRPGHTDIVTGVALRLDDVRSPAMRRYTRGVTWAWCGFFAAQLLGSAALLAWAPHRVWSLFANVLDGPLVVVMFAAEFAWRHLQFRDQVHVSPMRIWRSYLRDGHPRAG